jgi:sugar lactone lactonase YvrE
MRAHSNGKLYIARYGKGVVAVVSAEGELLEEITLKGKYPTNLAFGGVNGKQVFVTMQQRGAIETFFIK